MGLLRFFLCFGILIWGQSCSSPNTQLNQIKKETVPAKVIPPPKKVEKLSPQMSAYVMLLKDQIGLIFKKAAHRFQACLLVENKEPTPTHKLVVNLSIDSRGRVSSIQYLPQIPLQQGQYHCLQQELTTLNFPTHPFPQLDLEQIFYY